MTQRRVCVVTGSRAEYGMLYWVMKEIQQKTDLDLQVIATGMHLSPEFGLTWHEIKHDGFPVDCKVEMLLSSDTSTGVAKSIGLGIIGFADALATLRPDILVLLGDRFEIFAAAQAALVARIPVAHIAGGDTTEGAFDEAIRHAITKMAHLHFATNEESAARIRQLGENPAHVYTVGSPGVDYIKRLTLMNREELERDLGFTFRQRNLLVTFHPATLDPESSAQQFGELLQAIDMCGQDMGIVFTRPNADTDGRILSTMIDHYTAHHQNAIAYTSLGQLRYLSVMAQVDAVVGNSSSGLYEAPSLHKSSVNIGMRQQGRLKAVSVFDCKPEKTAIYETIQRAMEFDSTDVVNPYGDGESAYRIAAAIAAVQNIGSLLQKKFFACREVS